MKRSIIPAVLVVVLAMSLKAPAQNSQYVTLAITNGSAVQLAVQPSQIVSLVGYDWTYLPILYGALANGGSIQLAPFNNSLHDVFGAAPSTSFAQIPQIITGLTNLVVSGAGGWATFQITTPSTGNVITNYVPADAIVIPTSATGNVQIILESSADLANWTAANPGTYSASSATNRFFRVRAAVQN